jgi:ribosome-binding protein aMBF1 (putative translation factor)
VPCAGAGYPFFVRFEGNYEQKGDDMKCEFCDRDVPALIILRFYTPQGIKVCEECYRVINSHRRKPYSKVMDKLALLEAGYHVNRKIAAVTRNGRHTRM